MLQSMLRSMLLSMLLSMLCSMLCSELQSILMSMFHSILGGMLHIMLCTHVAEYVVEHVSQLCSVGLYIGFLNPISVFTLLLCVESSLINQQPVSPPPYSSSNLHMLAVWLSLTPVVFYSPMSTLLMGHKPKPSSTAIHPRVHCKCFHVKCIASPEYPNNLQILVCLQLWTYIVWRMLSPTVPSVFIL